MLLGRVGEKGRVLGCHHGQEEKLVGTLYVETQGKYYARKTEGPGK